VSSRTYLDTARDQANALVCHPGQTTVVQGVPNTGALSVLPDGGTYVEVEATNTVLQGCQSGGFTMVSYSDTLQLARVDASGTYSLTALEQFNDVLTQTNG